MTPLLPLGVGTTLGNRYKLLEVGGSDGICQAYSAADADWGDECTLLELAPLGSVRSDQGSLRLDSFSEAEGAYLRQLFSSTFLQVSKRDILGCPRLREVFIDAGTSFAVLTGPSPIPDSPPQVAKEDLRASAAMEALRSCLPSLKSYHSQRKRYSNWQPDAFELPGVVRMANAAGGVREWIADRLGLHEQLFDRTLFPPELRSRDSLRKPASDLYSLCAVFVRKLIDDFDLEIDALGELLRDGRAEISQTALVTIRNCLNEDVHRRPQSVDEFQILLDQSLAKSPSLRRTSDIDSLLLASQELRIDPWECPACEGHLETPPKLPPNFCLACLNGRLRRERLSEKSCPLCRTGVLHKRRNTAPRTICPRCSIGILEPEGTKVGKWKRWYRCRHCNCRLFAERTGALVEGEAEMLSWDSICSHTGRARIFEVCDVCNAQFEEIDNRWLKQIFPFPKRNGHCLHSKLEWSKIDAGRTLGTGNYECENCTAQYLIDGGFLTIVSAHRATSGFFDRFENQCLLKVMLSSLLVGAQVDANVLRCNRCRTSFLREPNGQLQLLDTEHPVLWNLVGEVFPPLEWKRMARSLPSGDLSNALEQEIRDALRFEYRSGVLSIDRRHRDLLWTGTGTLQNLSSATHSEEEVEIQVSSAEIVLRAHRKRKIVIQVLHADLELLDNRSIGLKPENRDQLALFVEPITLDAKFATGTRSIDLTAEDLYLRLLSERN